MERELQIKKYVREVKSQGYYNIDHSRELTKSLVDLYLKNNCQDVLIVACGSSFNGSNCGRTFAEKVLKKHVRVMSSENFEFYDNLIMDDELITVVSFSGTSTNSISALEKVKAMGKPAIGITGFTESDFKYIADLTIDFGLNGEDEPYETKGVTLTALYFMLFALEAALARKTITEAEYNGYKDQMKKSLDAHDVVLNNTEDFINRHERELVGMNNVTFVGSGSGYALSNEAKLKFGELLKISTDCHELEEYVHGPSIKLQPNNVVFFLDSSPKTSERNTQIALAAKEVTPYSFIITPDTNIKGDDVFYLPATVDDTLLPLYALVFYQEMVAILTDKRHCFFDTELHMKFSRSVPTKSNKYNKLYNELLDVTF